MRLVFSVGKGHANLLSCKLACVMDGRPMSVESRRDFLSIPWCLDERRGNRSLVREGEQSKTKIVSFGQATERLLTVNGTTSGEMRI